MTGANGSFSMKLPPGRYEIQYGGSKGYSSIEYNNTPNGASPCASGVCYDTPTMTSPPETESPPSAWLVTVSTGRTTHVMNVYLPTVQLYSYHAQVSGARSQLDLFGYEFTATSSLTTDAPGVTFTKPIWTPDIGTWSDSRLRTTVVMGPGTRPGTFLITVHAPLGQASTTMTIYKTPGRSTYSARFGIPYNYPQA
jgi:hypothetical protein